MPNQKISTFVQIYHLPVLNVFLELLDAKTNVRYYR